MRRSPGVLHMPEPVEWTPQCRRRAADDRQPSKAELGYKPDPVSGPNQSIRSIATANGDPDPGAVQHLVTQRLDDGSHPNPARAASNHSSVSRSPGEIAHRIFPRTPSRFTRVSDSSFQSRD